jgi:Fe-S-cluster containining protein
MEPFDPDAGQEPPPPGDDTGRPERSPEELRQEVADGLLHAQSRLSAATTKTLETASFLYALIELLNERGLVAIEELDERKQAVGRRLAAQFGQQGMGVMLQDPEYDKYNFEAETKIDCASRVSLCHAACCRLPFALSKQDIRERVVQWDLGQPYMIAQARDGNCVHLERGSHRCTIHEQRPVPCRAFDCRDDRRIWLDFHNRVINPDINRDDWPQCLTRGATGGDGDDR